MLDVKQAVDRAAKYLGELFLENKPKNLLLEEVRLDDDERRWSVTLSFEAKGGEELEGIAFLQLKPKRQVRTIEVSAKDGKFLGMKKPQNV